MRVLAVVAHADDEVLGPGGTLNRHSTAGDEVTVLCLADRGLLAELSDSCVTLGVSAAIPRVALPARRPLVEDQRFEQTPLARIADEIRHFGQLIEPDTVYLHNPDDLNLDHAIAARATITAFRPTGAPAPSLLAFETISSSEWSPEPFAPNWFVELQPWHLDAKLEALGKYPGERRDPPHPRSWRGLGIACQHRGAQAGYMIAEAFKVIRHAVSV